MSLPFVRDVANLERYSLARANAGVYSNVIVGTRLQIQPLEGKAAPPLPQDHSGWLQFLARPLTNLIQQHSVLSVVVGDHLSPHPKFLRMPSVDLNKVIRVATVRCPADVSEVLAEEHRVMFDYLDVEVPLWRIIVVQVQEDDTFYILYNFQHAIGDGRSAMALTEQLVEQINLDAALHGTDRPLSSTVVTSPTHELPLNMEARVNCQPSYTLLIKEATTGLLLPGFLKKAIEQKYWAGEIDATLEAPHETEVDIWFLTQEETSLMAKAAKARNTTVQAILFAASVFATKAVYLSKVDKEKNIVTTTKDILTFGTPVSLRSLVQPPIARNDQGSYTSEITTKNIRVRLDTEFWVLAQKYRKEIVKGTTTRKGVRHLLEYTGLLEFIPKDSWDDFMKGHIKKEQHGRQTTLKLSNIGKAWDQTATEATPIAFKVLHSVFSQDASTISSPFTLNAATANGILTVTSTWQRATFKSKESAQRFMTEFKRILLVSSEPERKEYHFRDALTGF
ncbi:hypothetical protein EMPS_01265 [Entomortierella parvispora]|uniref:Alcohol acetyltransferase n=1 Tax=Entomortierella parvispora TaxID=205924 RepID=A0A9P3LSI6_9FUNG|nr:hypothetical protein EMPS_01265 [Entomortierella parvispora]